MREDQKALLHVTKKELVPTGDNSHTAPHTLGYLRMQYGQVGRLLRARVRMGGPGGREVKGRGGVVEETTQTSSSNRLKGLSTAPAQHEGGEPGRWRSALMEA